jgi:Cu+-exporting ATPase
VEGLQEISGKGLCGTIGSDFYEIGQGGTSLESNVISVSLKKNGFEVCQLIFENPIRPSAPQAISILAQKGISCFILSGDSQQRVLEVAKECGIPSSRAFGNLSPTMKSDHIRSMQNTCMIGDGTNDALALQEADVGIAVKGSTYINLQAADICFMRDGMESLNELFELAQKTRRLILRNLTFSLLYNLVGGSLAVAGFVSPLLAAILMPVSSVLIIVSTIGGLR